MKATEKQIKYIISLYKNISGDYREDGSLSDLSSTEASKLIDTLVKQKKTLRKRWSYDEYY